MKTTRLLATLSVAGLFAASGPGLTTSVAAAPPQKLQSLASCAFSGLPQSDPSYWPRGGAGEAVQNAQYRCSIAINNGGQVAFTSDFLDDTSTPGQRTTYRHAYYLSKGKVTDIGAIISNQFGMQMDSLSRDINDAGIVVGVYQSREAGSSQRAFEWTPGTLSVRTFQPTIEGASAMSLDPAAINNNGDVVFTGGFGSPVNGYRSFVVLSDGTVSVLPYSGASSPGGPSIMPSDLNDSGQVVGAYFTYYNPGYVQRAFTWTVGDTSLTDLPTLADRPDAIAEGVNNKGQIVGLSGYFRQDPSTNLSPAATIWESSTVTPSLLPWTYVDDSTGQPTGYSAAFAISDRGVVVGEARGIAPDQWNARAISWSPKRLTVLEPLGVSGPQDPAVSAAFGVNRNGKVVGMTAPSNEITASPVKGVLWQ